MKWPHIPVPSRRRAASCPPHLCLAAVFIMAGCGTDGGMEEIWGYDRDNGPNVWRELSPEFALCGEGTRQSPIDLVATESEGFELPDIDWVPSTLEVSTIFDDDNDIDFQPVEENTIEFDSVSYTMTQFHFHTPAEHTVEGRFFNADVHFVHVSDDGDLLVVGGFFDAGAFNNDIERLLEVIPAPPNIGIIENFDMTSLLPSGAALYEYEGSLTTPPCGEGVQWLVYDSPLEASADQLMELRDAIGGTNSRGIQPSNARPVRLSN